MRLTFIAGVVLVSVGLVPLMTTTRAADISAFQSSLERRYTTPHSLGNSYQFDPRDGWESVNITNLQYKYSPSQIDDNEEELDGPVVPHAHQRRSSKKTSKKTAKKTTKKTTKQTGTKNASKAAKTTSASKGVSGLVGSVKSIVDTMKAVGDPEPVTITWYTGHDLENPSCWSNPTWAPTVYYESCITCVSCKHPCLQDSSMACAITLEGWEGRPQCFKFLERKPAPDWYA